MRCTKMYFALILYINYIGRIWAMFHCNTAKLCNFETSEVHLCIWNFISTSITRLVYCQTWRNCNLVVLKQFAHLYSHRNARLIRMTKYFIGNKNSNVAVSYTSNRFKASLNAFWIWVDDCCIRTNHMQIRKKFNCIATSNIWVSIRTL